MSYFVVTRRTGLGHREAEREQAGWEEHAAFMDALADEGFILFGGPVTERLLLGKTRLGAAQRLA